MLIFKGQGCVGIFYNFAGTFTSPLYPQPYRKSTTCAWSVNVPKGLKVRLDFEVFDIPKNMCESVNLAIYEYNSNGDKQLMMTYCGGVRLKKCFL